MAQPHPALEQTTASAGTYPARFGAPEGQDARLLGERCRELARERGILVHIAQDDQRLSVLSDLLGFFAPDVEVAVFPGWDCLPYDRVSPHPDVVAQRIVALSKLRGWEDDHLYKPRLLLTTIAAATQRVLPAAVLDQAQLLVRRGGRLNEAHLKDFLAQNGYLRTETVREAGEFAIRGGIIDLFPPGRDEPLRLDLFGDEVDKLRSFDPVTQMTTGDLDGFSLRPVTEFFLNPDSIARFRAAYRDLFGVLVQDDPLYQSVSEGRRHAGMEHWLPLFFERMETVFDYSSRLSVSLDGQAVQAWGERDLQIKDFYQSRLTLDQALSSKKRKKDNTEVSLTGGSYHPLPPELLYLDDARLHDSLSVLNPIILQGFASPEGDGAGEARRCRDFADIRATNPTGIFSELGKYLAVNRSERVMIACYSTGSRERLRLLMNDAGLSQVQLCDTYDQVKKLKAGQTGLCVLGLEHGFEAADLTVLTEQDILGDRLIRKSGRKRKADNFLKEISSLSPGDLVVHVDHGVGRFEGLETLKAAGLMHDCLKIIYAGGDKLFVPVENMEVLSRFGSDEGTTDLDKLGGAGWQARKAKVRKNLMAMAEALLKIAAERLLRRADPVTVESHDLNEFVSRFPYQETEDQLRAIEDVMEDFESGRPMDRLVCGDVGFGKTEVALRAAYMAARAGMQVAVVAPTTLLARQHYRNFTARFQDAGMRIGHLSRLVSAKDAARTRDELAEGSVRIVIGTHALLAKGIKFSNLGLVIVDEEQRFGVKQKERLKELKANVHVLTLTATPIPRTLQMALTGVRDMSIIATPPIDRLAIRTSVMPFDTMIVREAILREHYRGGQTFYVCPRIKDMDEIEQQLKEMVPDVRVITAHGQMTPAELEDRMTAFYEGRYGILLATNIIESGLDIPSANTIIVHKADLFGLAQLYQIRGRVGRSKVRAYAYITYDPQIKLSALAQRRLEVFETLDSLGAGFQLASHDLDIRGAGNLLGDDQSGHIREVGIELYQQMLEEAVAASKAGVNLADAPQEDSAWSPTINLGSSVLIPDGYVEDLGVRMSLYRRLSELETVQDIDGFAVELVDRFGEMPSEVANLLDIVRIKQLCRQAGVLQLDAGPKGAVIAFHQNSPPNPEKLLAWMQARPGTVRLRPDQKLSIIRSWDNLKERVKGVQAIMADLASLAH